MRITVTSVFVDDQAKALAFYTDVLGFRLRTDIPVGEHRWLTVVSPEVPEGVELLLEPDEHPAARTFKVALVEDGIAFTSLGSATSCGSTSASAGWGSGSPRSRRTWVR